MFELTPSTILILSNIIIMFVTATLSYYLGRKKTNNPVLTGVLGLFFGMVLPLAIVYLSILILKSDVETGTSD